jgi:type I restriction enzyme, S subunit
MTSISEMKALAPWMETLPSDWEVSRIDAVADVLFSNVDKHTIDGEQPVQLCNYVDVYKNERITAALDFMDATAEAREVEKFQIRRHDVLATKDSETPDDIAVAALVAEDFPGVLCGYHLAMLRPPSKHVYGPFIGWAHASKQFRAQYEAKAVGVTRFGLPQYAFRVARIPVPPLPEQERIAAYLVASCAMVDAVVTAKRRQIYVLDQVRKNIVQRAVTRGLGDSPNLRVTGNAWMQEVPAHWGLVSLKRMSVIQTGLALRKVYEGTLIERPYCLAYAGNGIFLRRT